MPRILNEMSLDHRKILLCFSKSFFGMMEVEACDCGGMKLGERKTGCQALFSFYLEGFEEDTLL